MGRLNVIGDVAELLDRLASVGLTLTVGGPSHPPGALLLTGPKAAKTAELLQAVQANKAELVRRLSPGEPPAVTINTPVVPALVTAEIEAECRRCQALICFPASKDGVFCERRDCPYQRLGTVPRTATPGTWRW